jgi:cellulose synthase/poly-beta-1,6-N-acetylglucosamine synthase-like glycosyltransferase
VGDAYTLWHPFVVAYVATQTLYTLAFLIDVYLLNLPVNWVDMQGVRNIKREDFPHILLFYPVLRELEATMRTTFLSLAEIDYPPELYSVVAIPNADDVETVASLERLQAEFPFLRILEVPPTTDPRWDAVWRHWDRNPKAYWWHRGPRAKDRNLPPKKTRQLIYAFYTLADKLPEGEDFLVNYIDADSCPPRDHFLAAAVGMQHYDILQAQNIAGNLNDSLAASWHAMDHMAWDGRKYPHLSANGTHPYWVLGKGLFYKASDLLALGGFHPWMAIEDPEVGMRFWINGKRLGIIENPLVEEVPLTFRRGIIQRQRWVCGFFQSLNTPLHEMGFTPIQRLKAWTNFLPCLSFWIGSLGIPLGIWALWTYLDGTGRLPTWTIVHAIFNLVFLAVMLLGLYWSTWKRTAIVLDSTAERLWYLLRINPVFLMIWWLIWIIPLWIGWRMYRNDTGLVWARTLKLDANASLVRKMLGNSAESARKQLGAPTTTPQLTALPPTG